MSDNRYHAWYSAKAEQAEKYKYTGLWRSPISNNYLTENGDVVRCTIISKNKDVDYYWNDKVYRGIVTKWVSSNY